ncbi:MAG: DUF5612 domain-containing protein [Spirochaetales bacterium]|nr:DUF5612 domain-containing protein [Spirochaetales bacterium]
MEISIPAKLKERYLWIKKHSASDEQTGFAVELAAADRKGLIADISGFISSLNGNLSYMQSWPEYDHTTHILIQIEGITDPQPVLKGISSVESVTKVTLRQTYSQTYGKRVIVLGGGAQVAQVAAGAIAEADRHNIRGERISVDTIAIVGETEIANAVRAVGRLHRAAILVLAGALMGGKISDAVGELKNLYGIPVMSLKMAGSVNRVSDIIVSDPLEAGVMAVMLISHIGKFNLLKVYKKEF